MTEERKAELRLLLKAKQRSGTQAAASVLQLVSSLEGSLDPSEICAMVGELARHFQGLDRQAENDACAYEIEEYGVELLNIDGQWDEVMVCVDARQKPWEFEEVSNRTDQEAE